MSVLTEKLDKLREMLQSEKFLNGDGLSNEVNIRIFCYDPKEEMTVQHFVRQLLTDQDLGCHLIECNLYQILLSICDEMVPLEDIIAMEEAEGSDALLEAMERDPVSAEQQHIPDADQPVSADCGRHADDY